MSVNHQGDEHPRRAREVWDTQSAKPNMQGRQRSVRKNTYDTQDEERKYRIQQREKLPPDEGMYSRQSEQAYYESRLKQEEQAHQMGEGRRYSSSARRASEQQSGSPSQSAPIRPSEGQHDPDLYRQRPRTLQSDRFHSTHRNQPIQTPSQRTMLVPTRRKFPLGLVVVGILLFAALIAAGVYFLVNNT